MSDLTIDPARLIPDHEDPDSGTGIFVRANGPDGWGSFDIAELGKPSLLAWLRSRGGENPWAEDVVGILLGHGYLHGSPDDVVPRTADDERDIGTEIDGQLGG